MNKPTKNYISTAGKAKSRSVKASSGHTNPTSGDGNTNAKMGNPSLEGAHANRGKHSGIY